MIKTNSSSLSFSPSEPVDTDDSRVYSDIQMTPLNLKNILRRRREIRLNDPSSQRRKRALSPYDFDETDSVLRREKKKEFFSRLPNNRA